MSSRVRCPHCTARATSRAARNLSESTREIYYQCTNIKECGFTWVAHLSAVRTLNPSRMPNPIVHIPLTDRSPPAAAPPTG